MNTTITATTTTSVSSASTRISVPSWGIPISRKAYIRFVQRIRLVYADNPAKASDIERSLELYLSRDTDYALYLADPADQRGFEFLRQEIDIAIERSAKARERARLRKERNASTPAPVSSDEPVLSAPEASVPSDNPDNMAGPLPAVPADGAIRAELPDSIAGNCPPSTLSAKIENGECVIYDPACEGASPDEIMELRIDPSTFRGTPVKGAMTRSERRAMERDMKKRILAAARRDKNANMR
ncbi:MAG: hypothetical protein NC349_04325 [Paenibacillus sp.]|nr:hypothetical protein [Paenibacillus sp.]